MRRIWLRVSVMPHLSVTVIICKSLGSHTSFLSQPAESFFCESDRKNESERGKLESTWRLQQLPHWHDWEVITAVLVSDHWLKTGFYEVFIVSNGWCTVIAAGCLIDLCVGTAFTFCWSYWVIKLNLLICGLFNMSLTNYLLSIISWIR